MEYQIKSNLWKVMIFHFVILTGIWVIGFILIKLIVSMVGDISLATDALNISLPSKAQASSTMIGIGLILSIGWTLMKYVKYAFTTIKVDETQISLFMKNGLDEKNLSFPLENISRIFYEDDLIGKLFGCKTIKLETTGTEGMSFEIDYVDKGKEWVEFIQQNINHKKTGNNYQN